MRLVKSLIVVGVVLGSAACGSKANTNNQAAETSVANAAQIPSGAIIRVPVDANGNPTGEPSMRTVSADKATVKDGASMSAAFEAGAAPESIVKSKSELDGNTSTQSWCGWSYGGYGYGYGGYGYGGYGVSYWQTSYFPVLYYGGGNYGYGYGGFNNFGGYNYYSYWR